MGTAIPLLAQWIRRCPPSLRPVLRTAVIGGALLLAVVRMRNLQAWRGKIRRLYLLTFRRNYVQTQLAQRRGTCNQCGACCRLVIPCPFLYENRCLIYGICRPTVCKAFPIDARDLAEVAGECSYTFSSPVSLTLFPAITPSPYGGDSSLAC